VRGTRDGLCERIWINEQPHHEDPIVFGKKLVRKLSRLKTILCPSLVKAVKESETRSHCDESGNLNSCKNKFILFIGFRIISLYARRTKENESEVGRLEATNYLH
jgi:hypothetical protein